MFGFDDRYSVPVSISFEPFRTLEAAGGVEAIVSIVFSGHKGSPQQRELSSCLSVSRLAGSWASAMPLLYAPITSLPNVCFRPIAAISGAGRTSLLRRKSNHLTE